MRSPDATHNTHQRGPPAVDVESASPRSSSHDPPVPQRVRKRMHFRRFAGRRQTNLARDTAAPHRVVDFEVILDVSRRG